MTSIKELNNKIIAEAKENRGSHGLKMLSDAIGTASDYGNGILEIYFIRVTKNRFKTCIINPEPDRRELIPLCIPEAGFRLYDSPSGEHKDGYQANGGGYSKPDHIVDKMIYKLLNLRDVDYWINPERQDLFNGIRNRIRTRIL